MLSKERWCFLFIIKNTSWPLEQGVIIQKYGKQKHKVFGNIETFNNGINIATNKNAIIRSVFDGKISRIFFIKGEGKAVLINHGEFFTVYSGLEEVKVKLGDNILSKEEIGRGNTIFCFCSFDNIWAVEKSLS